MMRFQFLAYFFFIPLCFFGQSDFQINNLKKKVVVPFQFINNLIFIPATVNGVELTFLLDSGVEQTILFSLDEENEIKLNEIEQLKLKGLGTKEAVVAHRSSKNKIEIKDFTSYNHEIYIILDQDFNFSSQVGIPVNGIIGYNFFKNHLIEIDYERKKISIYEHQNKKINKKIQKKFKAETINMEENKPYCNSIIKANKQIISSKLLVDTGNSDAVWVFLNKTNKIQLPLKNIPDYLGKGFSGSIYGKRGRIDSFEFGGKVFNTPLTTFPDSTSLKSVNFVSERIGSVGSEILSRFTVIFDYKNSKIYTKPNSKIDDPFHFNMSGIEVAHAGLEWVKEIVEDKQNLGIKVFTNGEDEKAQSNLKVRFILKPIFIIASVRVNSEAEKVGLQEGDKILSINHQEAHGYTIEKINELLKSEEGKIIEIEIERANKKYTFEFRLKSVI